MLTWSEETESLAHRLAQERKLSVDETVRRALEREQQTVGMTKSVEGGRVSDEEIARRLAVIHEFQQKFKALPKLDSRSIEEIFDEVHEL